MWHHTTSTQSGDVLKRAYYKKFSVSKVLTELKTVENEMGMIKSNQIFTLQRKKKILSLLTIKKR